MAPPLPLLLMEQAVLSVVDERCNENATNAPDESGPVQSRQSTVAAAEGNGLKKEPDAASLSELGARESHNVAGASAAATAVEVSRTEKSPEATFASSAECSVAAASTAATHAHAADSKAGADSAAEDSKQVITAANGKIATNDQIAAEPAQATHGSHEPLRDLRAPLAATATKTSQYWVQRSPLRHAKSVASDREPIEPDRDESTGEINTDKEPPVAPPRHRKRQSVPVNSLAQARAEARAALVEQARAYQWRLQSDACARERAALERLPAARKLVSGSKVEPSGVANDQSDVSGAERGATNECVADDLGASVATSTKTAIYAADNESETVASEAKQETETGPRRRQTLTRAVGQTMHQPEVGASSRRSAAPHPPAHPSTSSGAVTISSLFSKLLGKCVLASFCFGPAFGIALFSFRSGHLARASRPEERCANEARGGAVVLIALKGAELGLVSEDRSVPVSAGECLGEGPQVSASSRPLSAHQRPGISADMVRARCAESAVFSRVESSRLVSSPTRHDSIRSINLISLMRNHNAAVALSLFA